MCLDYLHTFRRLIFFTIFLAHGGTQKLFCFFRLHIGEPTTFFLVIKKDEYLTFEKGIFFFIQIAIKNLR